MQEEFKNELKEKARRILKFSSENYKKPISQELIAEFSALWLEWYESISKLNKQLKIGGESLDDFFEDGWGDDQMLEVKSLKEVRQWADQMIKTWAKQNKETIQTIENYIEILKN